MSSVILLLPVGARAERIPITLTAVGDVNLNRHRQEVREDGVFLWGKVQPFAEPFEAVARYIKGDLRFCNLETAVTDRNDIPHVDKEYNFRCHPNAVRAIQKIGFNLMSIANNHIKDYGAEGIEETRTWLAALADERPLYFAGAGKNLEQASEPTVFKVKGVRVAFAAVSLSSNPAGPKAAGAASIYKPEVTLRKLKEAHADIRILSMHAGQEKESRPVAVQTRVARMAVDDYDVDVVLGHHAHVVQGIEHRGDAMIFYGLGNFCMRGARNMGSVPEFAGKRDFGILVRLKMYWDTDAKKVVLGRLWVLPVFDMHSGPHPLPDEKASARIDALNVLSSDAYLGRGKGGLRLVFKNGRGFHDFLNPAPAVQEQETKKEPAKKIKSDKKKKDKKKAKGNKKKENKKKAEGNKKKEDKKKAKIDKKKNNKAGTERKAGTGKLNGTGK